MRDKIIIFDDDTETRKALICFLSQQGYEVKGYTYSSQAIVSLIQAYDPDLIILDVSTPSASPGLHICSELRKFSDKPVLFTSLYSDNRLRIDALNCGGDEIVIKPFSYDVLLAGIRAHVRRYRKAFPVNQRHLLVYPGLEIDPSNHSVLSYGKEIVLSTKEFQLLVILAKHPNRIFASEILYDLVWRDAPQGDIRTVMVHIYNLRQKIERYPKRPLYILTVRGAGYKFNGSVSL